MHLFWTIGLNLKNRAYVRNRFLFKYKSPLIIGAIVAIPIVLTIVLNKTTTTTTTQSTFSTTIITTGEIAI